MSFPDETTDFNGQLIAAGSPVAVVCSDPESGDAWLEAQIIKSLWTNTDHQVVVEFEATSTNPEPFAQFASMVSLMVVTTNPSA